MSDVLDFWLKEDIGSGDFTTQAVVQNCRCNAQIKGGPGVISGLKISIQLLDKFGIKYTTSYSEGDKIPSETLLFELEGQSHDILGIERTLLNILSHLSGISTLTAEVVSEAKLVNPNIVILATRKTTPGLRDFEKQAVVHGGGSTHRMRLDDAILIKDNHLRLSNNIKKSIEISRAKHPKLMIEVEADNLEQAIDATKYGADRVMLDNFTVEDAKSTFLKLKQISNIEIEISGGINLTNIKDYAAHADYISLSSLTMSSLPVDFTLHVI